MSEQNNAVIVDSSVEQSNVKKSWKQYFGFLKDRKFWKILFLGQLLSLCITGTNVVNTKLTNEFNFAASTTQSFLVYACLAIIYNSYAIYKRGIKGWLLQFWRRGIFYFILGFIDVEGNYFVNKSFQYTSLLSAELIDCWSTPVCMILSFIFLKVRFRWVQYVGVFICLCGLGMLVGSDVLTDKNYGAVDAVKGDLFCLLGATLYGFSNVGEEYMARKHPLYEVIGMFTFFATFINLVQIFIFERDQWSQFANPEIAGMIVTYTICMLVLYSLAPVIFRMGSAVVYNISLLTSDFYGLIFGLGLFGYKVTVLYPFAYVVVIVGIVIYHMFPAPVPVMGTFTAEKAEQEAKELHGDKVQDPENPATEVVPSLSEEDNIKH
ncbi:solute carrier family 35 member SLC35F1/F2/F6 [Gilbertella persicaria]|uniref:Solute carrier 35 member n=1 Tax=Rhizopus stolonifer TaxID=4846 RepID=A0A367IU66_RHIST|nr:solute carrier family 35 member SLC35F1/F2/F6 [Gilbertella persicaria]KAI8082527.1 solute carrier family 35 member SLC35F1/F2/F6 [Gilbertella persicaria]RCH81218.1 hypothetical protein CU098_004466 [Rhizopus stolonifer]